jgi:hypothetical protein
VAIVWGASAAWVSTPWFSSSKHRNCDLCVDLHEETVGMDLGSTYLKRLRTKPIEIFGIRFRIYCKKLQIGTKGRSNLVQLCFFTPYFSGVKYLVPAFMQMSHTTYVKKEKHNRMFFFDV